MKKVLYFCVGCRQVHFDNDYRKEDGDLEITDLDKFMESVENVTKCSFVAQSEKARSERE